MRIFTTVLAVYLLAAVSVFAQADKVATALRITEKISIDGNLEEPAWKLAVPATDLVQWRPRNGEPATERTEVRFLYDDDNLYVGISCFDSDGKWVLNDMKEDFDWSQSDVFTLVLDTLHDKRSGFYFSTNPAGAKRDGQIFNDVQSNTDWDGVWDIKVSTNEQGWFGEYIIPFKTLRFSNEPSQEWGVNFDRRMIYGRYEESMWSPIPIRFFPTRVSSAGTLRGLENIHQGRNFKVKPFVTAGITDTQLKTTKDYDGGVDTKYSLTPSLTLDTTYRTDFAQVEVDQQQTNLTRFNLFFPEKRDFFLENAGTFSFGPGGNLVPFFSRRIGLSSSGTPIPIIGGARVTGRVNRYDVGLLAMKTERATEGTRSIPSNNYVVGRIKRNLMRNSWIGALVTNRDSKVSGDYNRVYGTDAHFLFYDNKLEFDSYLLRSDTTAKSGRNQARRFETAWRGDELIVSGEYNAVQANFTPDVGFVRRGNVAQYLGTVSWLPLLTKSDTIRNLIFGTSVDYNQGGTSDKIETRAQNVNLGIQFENNSQIKFNVDQTFDRLTNPFRIRPDLFIAPGDYQYLGYSANFSSNPGRRISGNTTVNWGDFWDGRRKSFAGSLSAKPNHHWNFSVDYSRNHVTLSNGSFMTNLLGTRFIYAFSPKAFFNAFIQYNADTHQVSSNIRFDIIHRPLSDLYLVYNDTRNSITGDPIERAFIVKFTNLLNF